MEWTEAGVAGAFRFTQRRVPPGGEPSERRLRPRWPQAARALRRTTHRTIAAVSEALESFAFNVAVARLHEFATRLPREGRTMAEWRRHGVRRWRSCSRLIEPMMPHLAEEVTQDVSGRGRLVAELPWPDADPALLVAEP